MNHIDLRVLQVGSKGQVTRFPKIFLKIKGSLLYTQTSHQLVAYLCCRLGGSNKICTQNKTDLTSIGCVVFGIIIFAYAR
ncbi:hypothetical protein J2S10_002586 [Neobacillus ginsengisoli]|uniref:Uncharacterized protein n=1 Tax=Neobacillus ginsengisoli TaxID=904295 RepID=A0ABT9XV70_9BACI|nr:hypothetical protein [Neobacillus ginsengisoli]